MKGGGNRGPPPGETGAAKLGGVGVGTPGVCQAPLAVRIGDGLGARNGEGAVTALWPTAAPPDQRPTTGGPGVANPEGLWTAIMAPASPVRL